MAPEITIKNNYILVEPQENDYWEIYGTVGRLFKMPEYPDKNVIWVFRAGPINLAYGDLYKLRDFIKEYYPQNATRSKTAIVVVSGLQQSMAESFSQIAQDLPYEIKVFSDTDSAEDWISS